jgi:hypothetical protein
VAGRLRDTAGEELGDVAQLGEFRAAGRAPAQVRRQLVGLGAGQPSEGVDAEAEAVLPAIRSSHTLGYGSGTFPVQADEVTVR